MCFIGSHERYSIIGSDDFAFTDAYVYIYIYALLGPGGLVTYKWWLHFHSVSSDDQYAKGSSYTGFALYAVSALMHTHLYTTPLRVPINGYAAM